MEAIVLISDQCEGRSCIIVIMADTWFTSDFHLGHFNIIRYCNRPFADTREMDEVIVDRLNASVKPNDTLCFLGDFCLGKHDNVAAYRNRLACQAIHFIDGNHNKTTRRLHWQSLICIRGRKPGRASGCGSQARGGIDIRPQGNFWPLRRVH